MSSKKLQHKTIVLLNVGEFSFDVSKIAGNFYI